LDLCVDETQDVDCLYGCDDWSQHEHQDHLAFLSLLNVQYHFFTTNVDDYAIFPCPFMRNVISNPSDSFKGGGKHMLGSKDFVFLSIQNHFSNCEKN